MARSRFRPKIADDGPVHKRNDGFTLIELLIVVVIIGVLAAVAVPYFLGQRNAARDAVATADLAAAKVAVLSYSVLNNGSLEGLNVDTAKKLAPLGFTKSVGTSNLWVFTQGTTICIDIYSESGSLFYVQSVSSKVLPGWCSSPRAAAGHIE